MKILIFIEHDIIIRHFLHSHIFDELVRQHDVVFVFPEAGHKRVKTDVSTLKLDSVPLYHLPVLAKRLNTWQGLMLADMLRWRTGDQFAALRRHHRYAVGRRAALLFSVLALPGIFQLFEAWSRRRIRGTPYHDLEALLDREHPDVLIHPSVLAGVFINDLIDASQSRKIHLIVIMNSWDNPSTKRAMSGQPDWLLVWGPQTKSHAMKYLGMQEKRVVCFGAAQFDLYRNPPRVDRHQFCRRHNIDPKARVLLYAGSSKGTDEFSHLRMLDDAIEGGDLGHTIVVYRPHPWGEGGIGGSRIIDHEWRNVRIEETMRGYLELVKTGNSGITTPDYRDTHDLLSSVDALVSPLSTIMIEGALHGKPVLCFLPEEENKSSHYARALPLTHFDDFFAEPRFLVAKGENALISSVRNLLDVVGDDDFAQALRRACEHFVSSFDQPFGVRLVEFLESTLSVSDGGTGQVRND